jgi:hypothetical protein
MPRIGAFGTVVAMYLWSMTAIDGLRAGLQAVKGFSYEER